MDELTIPGKLPPFPVSEEVNELLKVKPRERLNSLPHRQNMDVEFENIVYTVPINRAKKGSFQNVLEFVLQYMKLF